MEKRLPNVEFRKLVKSTRDPEFKKEVYEAQEQREIDWPAYNLAQIKQIKETLKFIRESVNLSYCPRVRSNATNPKYLAKAILISEMIQSPEREAEGWVEILGPFVGIHERVDDWVLGDAYSRLEVARILYEIFLATRDSDGILQGDGTGLERTRKQNYESQKKNYEGWYMTSIVDSREIVQAFDVTGRGDKFVIDEAADRIANGEVIGRFSGGSEAGPRALGHRSILADPRKKQMRDHINFTVKNREWYRPFAPTVLEDEAENFFDISYPSPFMLFIGKVIPRKKSEIPSVTHIDGTARVQTISESQDSCLYELVRKFGEKTRIPILLNTSFNRRNEPIVESPEHAVEAFIAMDLDALILEDTLIVKRN